MTETDVIIIGAGVSGMYQLHELRRLGLSTQVLEAGSDVGGTWYWNRYPGCRFDSESWSYGYSWDQEILAEWNWSEHFAAQPETLRYLGHVADKFDLRRDIRFNTRVASAVYEEEANRWAITSTEGDQFRSRILITAIGALSVPQWPTIDGLDDFTGEAYHTGLWPHDPVSFEGKNVAVIGTGATGVQVIQEVAKTAAHLSVFQRHPNWCAPLNNSPIDEATMADIRSRYSEIFEQCKQTFGQFIHAPDPRNATEVSEAERIELFEKLYDEPGFGIWMANFRDVLVDDTANRYLSEFIADKIRQRVNDPVTAEKLIPENHGFGTRRVPLETRYYEVYNQDNVELVDISETPIGRITSEGVRTVEKDGSFTDRAFDIIVYATGFDAVTGAFERIDFRGVGGQSLKDSWSDGVVTFLGLQIPGFPNLFTLVGPHNSATFCNIPRCIEQNVEWVSDFLERAQADGVERIEASPEAAAEWTEHVHQAEDRMLFSKVPSWFTGFNSNKEGGDKRRVILYAGGAPLHRSRCDEVAANDYDGFILT